MSERPAPPPFDPPEGYEWVATTDDPLEWTVLGPEDERRPCRFGRYGFCRQPSVAILWRGRRRQQPWHYCADHLYGRWIEAGKVYGWHTAKVAQS